MATNVTVITGEGATSYTVSAGSRGPAGSTGATGATGATGSPGPNTITTATTTPLVGFLSGNGTTVTASTSASFGSGSGATFGSGSEAAFGNNSIASFGSGSDVFFGSGSDATFGTGGRALFANNTIKLIGTSNTSSLNFVDPTSAKTITLPDATGTVALTNDPRFTDARTPLAHTHVVSDIVSIAGKHLLGRHANSNGSGQEVTVGNGLEFQGSGIRREALTGDITASAGSNETTLAGTIAGDKTFSGAMALSSTLTVSGQLELTGQAATNKTSAMTKDLAVLDRHVNSIRRMAFAVPTVFSTGGGTSSVTGDSAFLSIASAAAGSIRGANFIDASPHSGYSGAQLNFARPFIASGVFYLRDLTANTTCLRFLIGGAASFLANANAFSTNGVGIEIKNVTSSGFRARLVYFSSTLVSDVPVGYVETAFVDYGVGSGITFNRSNAFVLTNNGLGTVNLYIQSYADSASPTTKPPVRLTTPLITITDAPRAAASASNFTATLATTAGDAAGINVEMKVRALQFDYND